MDLDAKRNKIKWKIADEKRDGVEEIVKNYNIMDELRCRGIFENRLEWIKMLIQRTDKLSLHGRRSMLAERILAHSP